MKVFLVLNLWLNPEIRGVGRPIWIPKFTLAFKDENTGVKYVSFILKFVPVLTPVCYRHSRRPLSMRKNLVQSAVIFRHFYGPSCLLIFWYVAGLERKYCRSKLYADSNGNAGFSRTVHAFSVLPSAYYTYIIFKNSVRTSKRTPHMSVTKISWLILFK
jgi:hypothetical protein